jgi:hypothetical protein
LIQLHDYCGMEHSQTHPQTNEKITIQELYPHLSATELEETHEQIVRYLNIVQQIYENLQHDPQLQARYKSLQANHAKLLTEYEDSAMVQTVEY